MKKITVEEVMKALRKNASAEFEEDWGIKYIDYYLHITEDGEIVDDMYHADESFTRRVREDDYTARYAEAHGGEVDWDAGGILAEIEDDPDSDFRAICEDLTAQANAWLAENAD